MISELLKKNIDELGKELQSKKQELEDLRRNLVRQKDKNTSKVKNLRKQIARIQTAITAKSQENA